MQSKRYPNIFIRSKNELAKQISHDKFSKYQALALINDVLKNSEKYWKDHTKMSEPEKGKFVRTASHTKLGLLLEKVNKLVLAPHDKLLPVFIFGGVKKKNHVGAAKHLLGKKRQRVLLKMDITGFFEQIHNERVFQLFHTRFGCDVRTSKIVANLCCVPKGIKGSGSMEKTIGRGFATSSRLAIWCNLDIFIQIERLVQKRLQGKDARLAIYVDDIGITASRVPREVMNKLAIEIKDILLRYDPHQSLPLNDKKTKVISHEEGMQHLGVSLGRNKLSLGLKTKSKRDKINNRLKDKISPEEKRNLLGRKRALGHYQNYVERKV
jgi:hypothetical protein